MTNDTGRQSRHIGNVNGSKHGNGEPPPSTLAAQLVDNLSSVNREPQQDDQRNFEQLLLTIVGSDGMSATSGGVIETDLNDNYKLINVVTRAGLEVMLQDDPFAERRHLLPQALNSILVIELTIQRTPAVLFFNPPNIAKESGKLQVPLYLWLLPKLLALSTVKDANHFQQKLMNLLSTILTVTTRYPRGWQNCEKLLRYFGIIINDLLVYLEESVTHVQITTSAPAKALPSNESLSNILFPYGNQNSLPASCQIQISNVSNASIIALRLCSAIGPWDQQVHKPHLATSTLGANQIWPLDALSRLWSLLQRAKDRTGSIHFLTDTLPEYLDALHRITLPLIRTHKQNVFCYKAGNQLAQVAADVLRLRLETFSLDIQKRVSVPLLAALQSLRASPFMFQIFAKQLSSALSDLLSDEPCIGLLTKDLQLALVLCSSHICPHLAMPRGLINEANGNDHTLAFEDAELHKDFGHLTLEHEGEAGKESSPPRKRLRLLEQDGLSVKGPIFMELVKEVYSLLGSQSATDLDGLSLVARTCYSKLSEREQCLAFTHIGNLCCAGAGTLELRQTNGGKMARSKCTQCDVAAARGKELSRSLWQGAECDNIVRIFSTLFEAPEFQKSRKPRICAMQAVRRLVNHSSNIAYLDLSQSFLGQWCLQCQHSSLRELRLASGRTLPLFLRKNIEDDVLRRNRILALDFLRSVSEKNELALQETCIITWAQIARVSGRVELNIILLRLVEYLGSTNSFIYGSSYNELHKLAQWLDESPKSMLKPFWRSIGITVVKDLQSRPQVAQYLSDLLGITIPELLVLTQASTLPYLILMRKKDIIERIALARGSGTTVRSMCFEQTNLAAILAVLLVQPSTDIESATMNLLRDASSDFDSLELKDLLLSSPILTACELLKAAGDADDARRPKVHQGIQYLASTFLRATPQPKGTAKKAHMVGRFFEVHVLGIMAEFSDTINNVRVLQPITEKERCLKAINEMIKVAKSDISNALPQICACLQAALHVDELRDQAFTAWSTMVTKLGPEDIETLIESTFSLVVQYWTAFESDTQQRAHDMITHLLQKHSEIIRKVINTVPSLASVPLMSKFEAELAKVKAQTDVRHRYQAFISRCQHENATVVSQALTELVPYLRHNQSFLNECAVSQQPDPVLAQLTRSILDACIRFDDSQPEVARLCAECIGLIGCLDPNRIESVRLRRDLLVLSNFEKADETIDFIVVLLQHVLVKAFLSARNTSVQAFQAYVMQELLKFCQFDTTVTYRSRALESNATYRRWISLPESVRNTLTPLLNSRYTLTAGPQRVEAAYPIFALDRTHGTWLRTLVIDLLWKANGENAQEIFPVLSKVVRGQDLSVANFLFPFAALNIVVGGTESQKMELGQELLTVLKQPLPDDNYRQKENLKCCSESVFQVLDYFSRWMHEKKKQSVNSKAVKFSADINHAVSIAQICSVEQVLSTIPAEIMSQRAMECNSFARALFHWEQYIRQQKSKPVTHEEPKSLEPLFEHLQDIYTKIDEPDGIEGISAHIHVLNIDQQILEHRKAGRWTAAQSWYEILLAEEPDNTDVQVSLLTCLKESGQHEVLLNQVEGLRRSRTAMQKLLPFAVEAAWATGKWNALEEYMGQVTGTIEADFNIGIGRALLAMQKQDLTQLATVIQGLRNNIARNMSNTTTASFQACHDTMLKFHVLTDLESISNVSSAGHLDRPALLESLDSRLGLLGSYLTEKQYLLGVRRAAFQLSRLAFLKRIKDVAHHANASSSPFTQRDIASAWLTSARLARKGNFVHQAFNAVLHASQLGDDSATIEHSRLLWKEGHHRKAIQSLEGAIAANAFRSHDYTPTENATTSITEDKQQQQNLLTARAQLLLAKWLDTAGQTQSQIIIHKYNEALASHKRWEKGYYSLGKHYNKLLESEKGLAPGKQAQSFISGESAKLVVENYIRSLAFGAKYIFQTLPRILTLWLQLATDIDQPLDPKYGNDEDFRKHIISQREKMLRCMHSQIKKYTDRLPAYVFYTALPQIVARICHSNSESHDLLVLMIIKVVSTHPQQALWTLLAVVKSSDKLRAQRGVMCLNKMNETRKRAKTEFPSADLKTLVNQGQKLSDQLLQVCEGDIQGKAASISLTKDLLFNHKTAPCRLVIPLESTLMASLPTITDSGNMRNHKAFSRDTVTVTAFLDDVLVLSSLQRPRKICIRGSDGQVYGLLCKPKDDLRKDQRLMQFNTMINRSLKRDAESSKRRLYIRTYAVTPLNEECGLIEWVDNLKTIRDILLKLYKQKNVPINYAELRILMEEACSDRSKLPIFTRKIIPSFPPVFHEWFVEMFPEPGAWFAARLKYTRSCAVMSVVGHVLGLGDRHGENILLEEDSGGILHVDFNCLFDKGWTFEKPERVPFRLTHNMVDAFGVYGYDGPFRKSCELTVEILRQNEDTLMTILETFLYDPTTDFIGKKKRSTAKVPDTPQEVLDNVRSKVRGLLMGESVPLSVEGHVHELIGQAVDPMNLASMYIGWCAFF
ncbi:MAG: serine/threonine-protein kinase M1 [Candelina submexicana]|nr:MAG: serine/threonine-protein kinase M1 [Candelina submexicana]